MYAIERALGVGATAIELDVHATADGVLVVCHDPTLDRTTDGTGPIAAHTWAQLAELDAAYHFVPGEDAVPGRPEADYVLRGRAGSDPSLRMTRLEEVLDAHPGVLLNLDIKQSSPEVAPYEELLAATLVRYGRGDDVIVASFNDRSTATFAELAPEMGTSPGTRQLTAYVQALRRGEDPDAVITHHAAVQLPASVSGFPLVDAALVQASHALGLAVHVWTVDDAAEMEQLVGLGVDGIITNLPSVLADVLRTCAATWSPAP